MSTPTNKPIGFFHRERDVVKICGRFQIVAGPVMGPYVGAGYVPTRTGAGDYLLTFTGAASSFISGAANCECAIAATDLYAQFGAFTPGGAAAATLQIQTKAIAADTEVTVDDWVHFEVTLYGECLAA